MLLWQSGCNFFSRTFFTYRFWESMRNIKRNIFAHIMHPPKRPPSGRKVWATVKKLSPRTQSIQSAPEYPDTLYTCIYTGVPGYPYITVLYCTYRLYSISMYRTFNIWLLTPLPHATGVPRRLWLFCMGEKGSPPKTDGDLGAYFKIYTENSG